jgi:L-ascorbate metabolism protein UlaG (beta-lactamase superfamily)
MKILKLILMSVIIIIGLLALATFLFIQQDSFGARSKGERLERNKKSSQYKDGKFSNTEETVLMKEGISYFTLFRKQFFESAAGREPKNKLSSVKRTLNNGIADHIAITWFGHSTILLQLAGKNILIDPVFSERASPVQYFGSKNYNGTNIYSIKDLPKIDIILLSHDHYDHLDYNSIKQLAASVPGFYAPLGVGAHLEKWGVAKEKITEMDWWEKTFIDANIQLIATPARHFSGRGLNDRNSTLWASYVIKTDSSSIYFGGDSGYGKHFKEIGDKYGPFDLTMLESGQYNEYWPTIHMMPEETVQANQDLKGKIMMPIHWGKFTLSWHNWDDPIERVTKKAEELNVKIITPMVGEEIIIDSILPQSKWWRDNMKM